ncbi:thioredoxin domain-containing protein [Candidatus Sumerlaeota bacterium]|nr:thioredoxin domain-containing protein [Candidatus Sumerlaeota bacterium]
MTNPSHSNTERKTKHVRSPLPSADEIAQLPPDGGPQFNRLIFEQSPYLLQHAANPVDWRPWGDDAFAAAKEQNKPVFLSIGYSTCHWCHVMEHESFEDGEAAAALNQRFICIKVDREERPDIDHLYMNVCNEITGQQGGWPLTCFLTPEGEPFFIGTYFPRHSLPGRIGIVELAEQIHDVWQNRRDDITFNVKAIRGALQENRQTQSSAKVAPQALALGCEQLSARFDPEYGGFGRAPKFPSPHQLSFLLRQWKRGNEWRALEMVEKTLRQMRHGGVFDQIGFGFHRYSTDRKWLVPHFEKMIYDQAMLMIACIETYQATGDEQYARTAREIATYVLRDMTSPEGGFYCAEDADSEGEEGRFYLWEPQEVVDVLSENDGALFNRIFNIVDGGNFLDEASRQKNGKNIPHLTKPLEAWAEALNVEENTLRERIEDLRIKLFDARKKRIHPLKDDKILTDWNGLMIAALARAGCALDEPEYIAAARKAADFLLTTLRREDGRLLKRYRQGQAGLPAHVEDYAFTVWGLLELYEATFDTQYLQAAIELNDALIQHFQDEEHGGFFLTADDGEKLMDRGKEVYDGAMPSGNSVAALNLIRLARITGKSEYEEHAEKLIAAFGAMANRAPSAVAQFMIAFDFLQGPSCEVVIAGNPQAADTQAMLRALRAEFIPNKIVILRPPTKDTPAIVKFAPYTEHKTPKDGKATAYVCQNYSCQNPTNDPEQMLKFLNQE